VQRQYAGTAGRVEDAQVAVYLAEATDAGHALVDRDLHVPRGWTCDPVRCQAAGVPAQVGVATKPALPPGCSAGCWTPASRPPG
jgi:SRSO17 transposase